MMPSKNCHTFALNAIQRNVDSARQTQEHRVHVHMRRFKGQCVCRIIQRVHMTCTKALDEYAKCVFFEYCCTLSDRTTFCHHTRALYASGIL